MLCSSITSIMGGVGQSDYCAANAYLDAFAAEYQRRTGIATVAVNWDPWKETGMAVDTAIPADLQQMREENLRFAIPTREGVEALRRILSMNHAQVVVSTTDLPARMELIRNPGEHVFGPDAPAGIEAATAAPQTPRALATPAAPPRDDLDRVLASIWQDLLGIQEVGVDDDFFELGGHSLLAIQITSRIHDTLGAQVPLASFFQATTVAKLADLMREQQETPGDLEAIAEAVLAIAEMTAEEVQDALEQRSAPALGD
jgi:acyl carrier protein